MLKKLLLISVFLFIVLIGFRLTVFDKGFYFKQYEQNKVNYPHAELSENTDNLLDYLNGGHDLAGAFFSEKEKIHLRDVKAIITKLILLFYASSALSMSIIAYCIYKKEPFHLPIKYSALSAISFFLILFVLLVSNFEGLFLNFHLISFSNDLWQLNPQTDNLINMFPQQFFYNAAIRISVISITMAVILLLISLIMAEK